MKKKQIILLCIGILLLFAVLILLDSTKYICRIASIEDVSKFEEIPDLTSKVPFINERERDKLLDKVVRREVKSFNDPITIEIISWDFLLHDGKETLWYMLRVRDVDGFVTVFPVIIQPRW